jgi:cytochrome c peroxidase
MSSRRAVLIAASIVAAIGGVLWVHPAPVLRAGGRAAPIGTPVELKVPLGLPPVQIPPDNPPTVETIALGRKLFYDPRLSVDYTVSCASCHSPALAFSDGKQLPEGVRRQKGRRNAPSLLNAAYRGAFFWDGRSPSLEAQAQEPVQNPLEMSHTLQGAVERLVADSSYRAAFERAFGPWSMTYEEVGKALASFERTLLCGNSPFDRYFYGHDPSALSESAKRGLEIFRNPAEGNCATCHTIGEKYALFTDNKFHNDSVGPTRDNGDPIDVGHYLITRREADKGAFRTPSLRNIALTAPYFHDGSRATLQDVIGFYIRGGNPVRHRDAEIQSIWLSGQDRADLQAFLESLTGEMPPEAGPPRQDSRQPQDSRQ